MRSPVTKPFASRARRGLLAGFTMVTLGAATISCRVPQRYDVEEVLGGLDHPWDLAFTPEGGMVLTERAGYVGYYDGVDYVRFEVDDAVAQGEGGMMGLALDPNWSSNKRLYTCYMTANDIRVVRWTVEGNWDSLGGRKDLLPGIPRNPSGRHSGCRLAFGPDGYLWITTGDAAQAVNPQNPQSLGGKILRIDSEGNAAPGNIGGQFLPQIWAYGFRNVQGIDFRPSDNRVFVVEHGPDTDDEITPVSAGGNGGWAPTGTYNENVPMTDPSLPNVQFPIWQSGSPTIAPSGATFVTDADWGDRAGQLAVAVLKGQELRMFNVADGVNDPGGGVLTGYGRLRTAVEGPDGRLYLLTDQNPGEVLAVQPVL